MDITSERFTCENCGSHRMNVLLFSAKSMGDVVEFVCADCDVVDPTMIICPNFQKNPLGGQNLNILYGIEDAAE